MDMAASCILIFILLFLSSSCKSDDTITHTKPLFSGDKLVSRGGDFALGFFSLSSSKARLYIGIWYNSIPGPRTTVWVANRDNPVTTNSSVTTLTVTNSSGLVLSDSQGFVYWTTKSNISAGATGVAAVLLNTGNFVLQLANGTYIWQSFDHPSATIIPTMKFLVSRRALVVGRLVAWKGPDDPSTGDFSCSGDPSSPALQMVLWNGARPYYRSEWSSVMVPGGTYSRDNSYIVHQTTASHGDEFYFTFIVSDGSPFTRIFLEYTGLLISLSWNNQSSSWVTINSHPLAACDIYSSCGPFGYCDLARIGSTCKCLDGFEPNGLDISGCQRKEALRCGRKSHFVALSGMKVPDKFLHIPNRSLDECVAECSSNCSCTAYAYNNLSSVRANGDRSRCLVWTGELIDTGKFINDTEGIPTNPGENLYLRLADSRGQKKINLVKILLPIIVCLLMLTCITLISVFKYKSGKRRKKEIQRRDMLRYFSSPDAIMDENIEFPFVSFESIVVATNNFSDSNLIGRGGFGKVYKGLLEGGMEIAIKRLDEGSGQGIIEFKNEIVLIAKLQHRNLVRLLGCCIHGGERLLIYEYLPNRSLDAFIFDSTRQYVLDWPTRFKIIKGIVRGLLYLHQDSRLTVIHRDLKASNILLDTEMNPKISDFGMARIFGENQQQANTSRVVGTYGYMSPEYVMGGAFSVKSDTYSFGVLLLEIVSGLKISSPHLLTNFTSLTTYAWRLWVDGNAREMVDSCITENCAIHEALRCVHIGLLCVQDEPNARPLMSSIVFMLENETTSFPAPDKPAYFAVRNDETVHTRENMEILSNATSITTLIGR